MPGSDATAARAAGIDDLGDQEPRHLARRAFLAGAAGVVLLGTLGRAAAAALPGDRRLQLYNPHTDEHFNDVYWCDGDYVPDSLNRVDWLMRDFHQDKVAAMDPALLDLLHRIAHHLGTPRPFTILSGYRTAATNRLLRREGLAPAAHSEHLLAKAADIRIDGVRLKHLRRAALALKAGGVGTYWHDDFVHVDVGPVRVW
jgi:uncharacterized protein YcbK (DUF882 family)